MKTKGSLIMAAAVVCFFSLVFSAGCISEFQKIISGEKAASSGEQAPSARDGAQKKAGTGEKAEKGRTGKAETITEADIESDDAGAREYFFHRIKWQGESLSIIAKWYLGDFDKWKLLSEINPGLDPQALQVGDRVRIPADGVKTSVIMPKDFLEAFVRRENKDVTGEKQKRTEQEADRSSKESGMEEPELFGPKGLNEE